MSVINPRNRLVNFRLTAEEFDSLKSASIERGARSVSDFARSAVLGAVRAEAQPPELNGVIVRLEDVVVQMERLIQSVESSSQTQAANAKPAQAQAV
jgi:hypothetical protein